MNQRNRYQQAVPTSNKTCDHNKHLRALKRQLADPVLAACGVITAVGGEPVWLRRWWYTEIGPFRW